MPNDPGPSSWLEGQYRKFLEGVEQVGTGNASRLARVETPVRVDRPKEPQITIPAWDDVIRTGPRVVVTPEDMAIQRHFERAGLRSPLAPELQQEIADRRAMVQRIRNSAIPEYQRGVATMVTAVDNVQDAALTLSVGGGLFAVALGRFGSWIAPAVAGIARVALALNWLGLALAWFGILYALACQGPRDALAQARAPAVAGFLFRGARRLSPRLQGIPTPFPSAGQKGRAGMAMFGTPSGRDVANRRASRWARAIPGFGELLQIGQTAYDLTGYGISLGAIMGLSSETAYAEARRQRGESVRVRSPQVNHELARLLAPRLAGLSRAALWHRHQCARALPSALFVLRDPWSWGEELYVLAWITFYASLEPLMWDTDKLPWRELTIRHLAGASWRPWDVDDAVSRQLLEPDELATAALRWPVSSSPHELGADRIVLELGREIGEALRSWLEEAPVDPLRRFVAEQSVYVCERVWWWLEGSNDWPAWKLSPATAVWESLFLAARWPIVSDDPVKLARAWEASEQYSRDHGVQQIPADELDRIWSAAGSPLLVLKSDQAPVPADFQLPWDADTGAPGDQSFAPTLEEARRRLRELLGQSSSTPPGRDFRTPPRG